MMESQLRFGRYNLMKRIAVGGMSEVFLAHHHAEKPTRSNAVVLKRILPSLASDAAFVAMFINEASLAAQMQHPNIVHVSDFGEFNGQLYLVMEFIDGVDAWRLMRYGPQLGPEIAVYIISEVLKGLKYAHGFRDINKKPMGIVHSDVSPSNIYLSRLGEVKLGDFGIARVENERGPSRSVIPKGKFGYMAPEQVVGDPFDHRADLFGTAVVLSELLIGEKIFSGKSQLSVLLNIRDVRLDPLERARERIPQKLYDILLHALTQSPYDRFPDAGAFHNELMDYLASDSMEPSAGDLASAVNAALQALRDIHKTPSKVDQAGASSSIPGPSPESLTPPRREARPDFSLASTDFFKGLDADFLFGENAQTDFIEEESIGKTPTRPELCFKLKTPDDKIITDMNLAKLIEGIYTNTITLDTLLSVNDGPFLPLHEVPEVSRHIPAHTPTMDVSEPGPPDRRGVVGTESIPRIMLSVSDAMETGLLIFDKKLLRKELYFKNGKLIYVTSNIPQELLGEFLVSEKVITRENLDSALDLLPRYDGHLGDTLVGMGLVRSIDLFRHIQNQVRARLLDLFAWTRGEYQLFRGVPHPNIEFPLDINMDELIPEGLKSAITDDELAEKVETLMDEYVYPAETLPMLRRFGFDQDIIDAVESVNGKIRVSSWISGGVEAVRNRALYVGLQLGRLECSAKKLPWYEME